MKTPDPDTSRQPGIDFLPDADAIERAPVARGVPITLYTLLAMLVALLAWAALADLDQVVVARGRLTSTEPNILIQPIETAQIEAINVTVGQVVKKGELLAQLESTFINADLSQVRERLDSLNAQISRLEAERAGQALGKGKQQSDQEKLQSSLDQEKRGAYRARLDRFEETLDKSTAGLASAQAEIRILERRLANQLEIEKMTEQLYQKEFQSRRAVLDANEKRLEIERDLMAARSRANDLSKEINGLRADRAAFANESKLKSLEELVTIRRERDSLQEQLNKSGRRSALIAMRAPQDGIVLEVARKSRGSVIREGETLVSMVPLGGKMQAEIRLDASEISFVKTGAEVRVKLDALPFQKYGMVEGTLIKLSSDALETPVPGVKDGQAYYTGIVEFRKISPGLLVKDVELKLGMTLTAEVMTGRRSVLSYVTYPLRQVGSEAMNER